jgi:ribonuclease HI
MLHTPILSGRMGKWAYALIEFDLNYEPLRATKGQVMADFVVDHMTNTESDACIVEVAPWRLFFDGSICSRGQGVGCVLVSPGGVYYEFAVRLEFTCMNNQAEYEGLLHGLELLREMEVKEVEALGDSNLVIQQIKGECGYLDKTLNEYLEQCLDILRLLDSFRRSHISSEDNRRANILAHQVSEYEVKRGPFMVKEKPMVALEDVTNGKSVEVVDKVGLATGARPTEIPNEGKVLAVSKGMTKLTAQPRMGNMSINRGDKMIRPMGQGDPAGASAIGKSSNEDNQPEPIT